MLANQEHVVNALKYRNLAFRISNFFQTIHQKKKIQSCIFFSASANSSVLEIQNVLQHNRGSFCFNRI